MGFALAVMAVWQVGQLSSAEKYLRLGANAETAMACH